MTHRLHATHLNTAGWAMMLLGKHSFRLFCEKNATTYCPCNNYQLFLYDFSVVTKKHVRQKYKDHVGRELTADEREQINKLVLDFVKNLAVEQTVRSACLYVSEIGHIQYSL